MIDLASKRIGIDCRLSGNTHAGIGRYIEELILRLPKLAPNIEWVYFFYSRTQANDFLAQLTPQPTNVKIVIAPVTHYSVAEQLQLPRIFGREHLDLLHIPHFNIPIFYSGKIVVTIHDLLWHEFTGFKVTTLQPHYYLLKYWAYRLVASLAIRRATRILVPAQTIKNTISHYYPSAAAKIVVTPEGFAATFNQPLAAAKAASSIHLAPATKTLLYIGSLYPHKNLTVVLKALRSLPDFKLKLIGSRNIFQDQTRAEVTKLGVGDQVEFTGYLDDSAVHREMSQALALVQPSLSEGFGLTGVEAMASGLPVLASNIPIFKEVYGHGAIFFDPHQPTDLVRAIQNLTKSNRRQLVAAGRAVAKQYSWDKMAQATLAIYNEST